MAELTLIKLSPTADSRLRWEDGTLKGIKTLVWKHGAVWSPLHKAEWVGARLVAQNYSPDDAVRGTGGIHAIWPPQVKDDDCAALEEFGQYARIRPDEFTVLVAGWGRSIMGDVGWRAEFCSIRCVISPPTKGKFKLRQWCREFNVKWSVI